MKIRLHGTEDECREMAGLLESVMLVQSVSEPYPDRGRSVLGPGVRRGDTARWTMTGTVYLLHFDQPYKHANHYIGWTKRTVRCRLAEHEAGRGARLLAVVRAAGIGWQLARCWQGGRTRPANQAVGRARPQVPAVRGQAPVPATQRGWVAVTQPDHRRAEGRGRGDDGRTAGRAHRSAPRRGDGQAAPAFRAGSAGRGPVGCPARLPGPGRCVVTGPEHWARPT